MSYELNPNHYRGIHTTWDGAERDVSATEDMITTIVCWWLFVMPYRAEYKDHDSSCFSRYLREKFHGCEIVDTAPCRLGCATVPQSPSKNILGPTFVQCKMAKKA
jgi:hypothetical protein